MNTNIVYGITDCPACLRACADLMEADIEYVFAETDFSKSYREYLKDKYEWPTFPHHCSPVQQCYSKNLGIRAAKGIYEESWRLEVDSYYVED